MERLMPAWPTIKITEWNPTVAIFKRGYRYMLVVKDQPIRLEKDLMHLLWKNALITVTVNGGLKRWLEYLEYTVGDDIDKKLVPTVITGNIEQISGPEAKAMTKLGSDLLEITCYDMDYSIALKEILWYMKPETLKLNAMYVLGENRGTFDYNMGNMYTLYNCRLGFNDIKVVLISPDSFTWLLHTGVHIIHIPKFLMKYHCSILPPQHINYISTSGLDFNLNNHHLNVGDTISAVRFYTDSKVIVMTSAPVIWTMSVSPDAQDYLIYEDLQDVLENLHI